MSEVARVIGRSVCRIVVNNLQSSVDVSCCRTCNAAFHCTIFICHLTWVFLDAFLLTFKCDATLYGVARRDRASVV